MQQSYLSAVTVGYQYNYRNEPTQITYPGSIGSVTVGYDTAGREHTVQDWNSQTTTFNYDADGNLTTTVFPGGSCTMPVSLCDTNTYNAADQLTGISDLQLPMMTIFSATYARDGNGQVTSDSSAQSSQNAYGYTPLDQLCYAGSNNTAACSSPPSGSQPFGYDNGDNLTTFGGRTQTFNTADELCWTVGGASSNGCSSPPSGAASYGYDGRDNRSSAVPASGTATCYSYSEPNWLTQIQTGSGSACSSPTTVATYLNNGDGLRMSKTVGSTTTRGAWDLSGSLPLQLVEGSTDYVYGPGGMVLEQISGSTTLWYHHDQAGGVRAISDSMGNVKATYTFDPYGNVKACTGATVTVNGSNICTGIITVSNPFAFDGQYRDDESGLYYLRARYYDPTTGQFLSRDPLVALTRSPYGYVAGNPLNATDPSGLIDSNSLSPQQRQQIQNECSTWQNQSLCRQAAFCTGDACHTVGQIAMNDNYLVQAALARSPCGNVTLDGGYQATHAEAERDLAETYQAFAVANETISYENHQATCDTARDLGLLTIIVGGGLTGGEAVGAFAEGSAAFDAGEYAEAASNYLKAGVISQHTVGFTLAGGALMGAFGGGC